MLIFTLVFVFLIGRYKDAADLMKRARKAGVTMDTVAYNTMMKANLKSGQLNCLCNS